MSTEPFGRSELEWLMSRSPRGGEELRLLVTGARGFIGEALVNSCVERIALQGGCCVQAEVRQETVQMVIGEQHASVADLNGQTQWQETLAGITHTQAANQTFLVSDGQDLSTTELVRGMAQVAGMHARLLPVPVWALQAGASLLGKGDAIQRLSGNLQVDISKASSLLGWVPPVSVEEGLRRAMAV